MNQHDPASAWKVEDVRINKQPVQNEHGLAVQCILGRTWKCTMLTHFNCARGYAADWRKIALAEKNSSKVVVEVTRVPHCLVLALTLGVLLALALALD